MLTETQVSMKPERWRDCIRSDRNGGNLKKKEFLKKPGRPSNLARLLNKEDNSQKITNYLQRPDSFASCERKKMNEFFVRIEDMELMSSTMIQKRVGDKDNGSEEEEEDEEFLMLYVDKKMEKLLKTIKEMQETLDSLAQQVKIIGEETRKKKEKGKRGKRRKEIK